MTKVLKSVLFLLLSLSVTNMLHAEIVKDGSKWTFEAK
ncbi:MAG: hypothetical protein JWQ38_292, partial [Flavipsychrobacter sp.]|nr:hypothetical protein [Flavipsychrobacter sp.]